MNKGTRFRTMPPAGLAGLDRRGMLGSSLAVLALCMARPLHAAGGAGTGTRKVTRTLALPGSAFVVGLDKGRITSLRDASGDAAHRAPGDLLHAGGRLGNLAGAWRSGAESAWVPFDTADLDGVIGELPGQGIAVRYAIAPGLTVTCRILAEGPAMKLLTRISNETGHRVEFGDVALPLPVNMIHAAGQDPDGLLKHSFISGKSSHLFWKRKDLRGPWLTMLPEAGTSLEYWDCPEGSPDLYRVYFHAARQVEAVRAAGSRWRLPASSLTIPAGESREMGVRFLFVEGDQAMRHTLADHGLLDVEVVPGMTVPVGSEVKIAFASRIPVRALRAEHPAQTRIAGATARAGRQIHALRFDRLGENQITVEQETAASPRSNSS
jgi:hypothetical protein